MKGRDFEGLDLAIHQTRGGATTMDLKLEGCSLKTPTSSKDIDACRRRKRGEKVGAEGAVGFEDRRGERRLMWTTEDFYIFINSEYLIILENYHKFLSMGMYKIF